MKLEGHDGPHQNPVSVIAIPARTNNNNYYFFILNSRLVGGCTRGRHQQRARRAQAIRVNSRRANSAEGAEHNYHRYWQHYSARSLAGCSSPVLLPRPLSNARNRRAAVSSPMKEASGLRATAGQRSPRVEGPCRGAQLKILSGH